MKKLLFILCVFLTISCSGKHQVTTVVSEVTTPSYSPVEVDSIVRHAIDSCNIEYNKLRLINDSITNKYIALDTTYNKEVEHSKELANMLLVDEIKLARIKKYNTIAAKGNNIKFLRGWINRVLSE